jgi:hypothetical protein
VRGDEHGDREGERQSHQRIDQPLKARVEMPGDDCIRRHDHQAADGLEPGAQRQDDLIMRAAVVELDPVGHGPDGRGRLRQFRMVLVDHEEQLAAGLVVHGQRIEVLDPMDDRFRQRGKARVLIERQAGAQIVLHRVLHDVTVTDQLLDVELLVGPPAFAVAHIDEEKEGKCRHDEHRDRVHQPPIEPLVSHVHAELITKRLGRGICRGPFRSSAGESSVALRRLNHPSCC